MANANRVLEFLLALEGGYSNNPRDPGGETKHGISKRHFPHLNILKLNRQQAKEIYLEEFWRPLRLDEVHDDRVAWEIMEQAVNFGQERATGFAQLCLNFLRRPVAIDGKLGPQTISALNNLRWTDTQRWLRLMNGVQFVYYAYLSGFLDDMVANFHAKEGLTGDAFFVGWLRRIDTDALNGDGGFKENKCPSL